MRFPVRYVIISVILGWIFVNLSLPVSTSAANVQKIALVIGNGSYNSSPLKNPVNDARDMAATLKELGFEVLYQENASERDMKNAIHRFGQKLKKGGIGLFYFAGHGMQVDGRNYLIPVNADIKSETDIQFESVDAGRLLAKMEDAGNDMNIVILDSCRDNPFARSFRSSSRGLARMDAPKGSFIAYATAPGQTAADGKGRNGIFTGSLLRHMKTPDLKIEDVLKRVRVDVSKKTDGIQIPWQSSSLMGDFYFLAGGDSVITRPAPKAETTLSVECTVSGARVFRDNQMIGYTNLPEKSVSPGSHVVRVEKEGYAPYRKNMQLEQGRSVSLFVDLVPKGPAKGRIFVDTDPEDARVRILNIVPVFYQGIDLEPGRYQMEISASDYVTRDFWVELKAGEDKQLNIRLERMEKEPAGVSNKISNDLGMEFVYIEPGSFMMGSPSHESGRDDDEKQHRVTLTKGFYMQTTEVTQRQWKAVMGSNPSHFSGCDNCPVENVSWEDAQQFIRKLNRRESKSYRLPTEAEWEYACRAGSTTRYSWGDNASCEKMMYENDVGSNEDNCVSYYKRRGLKTDATAPAASFPPNAWGLYDMHGNVWEWCQDWYGDYPSYDVTDPKGPSSGSRRVPRGGGWIRDPRRCRSAYRCRNAPGYRDSYLGFRLALSPVR